MEFVFIIVLFFAAIFIFNSDSSPRTSSTQQPVQKVVTNTEPSDSQKKLLEQLNSFFSNLLSYPLTLDQRIAIINDHKRNLVLASAGCGKSSVLIARYAYLEKIKKINSSKILIMAFNSAVRVELRERLKAIGIEQANIHTFHSFGRSVLEHQNISVELNQFAREDTHGIIATNLVEMLVDQIAKNNPFIKQQILEFRALCRFQDAYQFASTHEEYQLLVNSIPFRRDSNKLNDENRFFTIPSLDKNIHVRSQQELLIANWLIINGIKFEYEKSYPGADFTYKPDFYLNDASLWLEHFAIDRDGNSPFPGYVDEYSQKLNFHQAAGTNFECTYSYEYSENSIIEKLESILKKHGIEKKPLKEEQIEALLQKIEIQPFYRVITEILKLIKSNNLSDSEVIKKLNQVYESFRAVRFLEIIIPIRQEYEKYLSDTNTIDYDDMILTAANELSTNNTSADIRNSFSFEEILIDEFQDISFSRSELLKSLFRIGDPNLFSVGDDWQSIYRFTGADISHTLNFQESYRYKIPEELQSIEFTDNHGEFIKGISRSQSLTPPPIHAVKDTHRCSKNIALLGLQFITRNPDQLYKNIESSRKTNKPIKFAQIDEYSTEMISLLLEEIPSSISKKTIFILAPFNRLLKPENIDFRLLENKFSQFEIKYSSIHGSKGLEADHVILIGIDSGAYGFPVLWGEDPLRNIFLPKLDQYPHSEERRVFYVAMTRARESLIICALSKGISDFYIEAQQICRDFNIPFEEVIKSKKGFVGKCPECNKSGRPGRLLIKTANPNRARTYKRQKKYSVFIGCNMFNEAHKESPLFCNYSSNQVPCPNCLSHGVEGQLQINFNDSHPKVRLECYKCNHFLNYYDYFSGRN